MTYLATVDGSQLDQIFRPLQTKIKIQFNNIDKK